MSWTKEDRSFKTLINRRTTDSTNKYWYNEFSDSTINVHSSEIWSQAISSVPATAVSEGVAELKTLFALTLDSTVPSNQCYYAYDTVRLKDWISTKYGEDYLVHLFDNNNAEIYPTDASQWFFDYQTGILTFNGSTAAFTKPFKITAYRYVGTKGAGGTTSGTSGLSGTSGTSGIDGTSGTSGVDGTSGSSGVSGSSGTSGIDGTSGTSGVGTNGTSGSSGVSGLQWYDIGSSGEEFNVCATGTGITLSRTGSAYTLNFPAGVRILSAAVRIPLANMTTNGITLSTNLTNPGSFVNRMTITARGWREDSGGACAPTVTDSTLTYTTFSINALSTTTSVCIQINFHQPLTA